MRHAFDVQREFDRPVRRGDEGIAFLAVLLIITALSFLGIVGAASTRTELQMATSHRSAKEAMTVAEAGTSHAFSLVRASPAGFDTLLTNGGTGGVLAGIGGVVALDGENYRFRAFGNQPGGGYFVRIVDNHDEEVGANDPTNDRDRQVYIESRARVGGAERVVRGLVVRLDPDEASKLGVGDEEGDGEEDGGRWWVGKH